MSKVCATIAVLTADVTQCSRQKIEKIGNSLERRSGKIREFYSPPVALLVQWIEHVTTDHEIGVRVAYGVQINCGKAELVHTGVS